jgi:hypothetical protein
MNKLRELEDFSMFDGHLPCVLCKGESSRTIMGDHWKCSVCAHLFNQDGSEIKLPVPCLCETCRDKAEEAELDQEKGVQAAVKKLKRKVKKLVKDKKK